ncbi:hypothetical protein CQW23_27859 [Capsicum baccatum]|uniref:Uncharacterized protein n=1 Tax=Capsicum baccatum TaxID=33114 RepID=A0A2G2VEV3_CAPBA|nr:hypothetical protein CQW23_27859 [Capsicum baccatum]
MFPFPEIYLREYEMLSFKKNIDETPGQKLPFSEAHDHEEIKQWLDKKEKSSTVFVSFGSEFFLSKEEILEVVQGLELSKVNFILVIRFPQGKKFGMQDALPEGWICESLWMKFFHRKYEVWYAMPMPTDQPLNTRLVEYIGVGIAKVIRKVVVEESGDAVRKKAKELSEMMNAKGDEEIDCVAEELVALCSNK